MVKDLLFKAYAQNQLLISVYFLSMKVKTCTSALL